MDLKDIKIPRKVRNIGLTSVVKHSIVFLVTMFALLIGTSGGLKLHFDRLIESEFWIRVIVTNTTYFVILWVLVTSRQLENEMTDEEKDLNLAINNVDNNKIIANIKHYNEETIAIATNKGIDEKVYVKHLYDANKVLGNTCKNDAALKELSDRLDLLSNENNVLKSKMIMKLSITLMLSTLMLIGITRLKINTFENVTMIFLTLTQILMAFRDDKGVYESIVENKKRTSINRIKTLKMFDDMKFDVPVEDKEKEDE